jgi:methylmalonyl-CoA/ethylmalonyl-CoA epimerase
MNIDKQTFLNPIQIGMIVEDLEPVVKNLEEILGFGPFRIVDFPPEGQDVKMMYQGKPAKFKAKFCFFDMGNIELELIQPVEGENIWSDFLKANGGMGLHHIKFSVPRHEPIRKYFESKGINISQMGASVGKNLGKEWVFYDTEDKLGFAVELMNSIVDAATDGKDD